jgi:hypothetical protein
MAISRIRTFDIGVPPSASICHSLSELTFDAFEVASKQVDQINTDSSNPG